MLVLSPGQLWARARISVRIRGRTSARIKVLGLVITLTFQC